MKNDLEQASLFVPVNSTDELHLKRIHTKGFLGPPVFMLHGSIENGRIFYSQNGKGLAPYLARNGFDVFVGDLRGRGESRPRISRYSRYGQTEAITQDIPAMVSAIRKIRGDVKQRWIAHSWGGVLMASYLARFDEHRPLVDSMVCFATKRTIRVCHLKKRFIMDFCWGPFARLLVKVFGYLPTKQFRLGSDNETDKFHHHIRLWVKPSYPWIDPDDGFDYGTAIQQIKLPKTLHLVGVADSHLGNPKDVRDFMKETGGVQEFIYQVLSKREGNLHDYSHVDILTHPDAVRDHFPLVLNWLRASENSS